MRVHIEKLIKGDQLNRAEAKLVCEHLLRSDNVAQSAALLALMESNPVNAEVILGFMDVMRKEMTSITLEEDFAIDIVGTGGDGADTVNISTAASLVAASCGAMVVKHGSRANSSRCGSADFLEHAGVKLELTADQISFCAQQINMAFCFAPVFHPLMKDIKELRKSLEVRTIFNILGPLLNPAKVKYILLGVYSPYLLACYSEVLLKSHITHGMVVHGSGLDELNCLGVNQVIELCDGSLKEYTLDPEEFGFSYCQLSDLQGGDVEENYQIIIDILQGNKQGPIMETIALNAGAALYICGAAPDIKSGVQSALLSMQLGKPFEVLTNFASLSQG